jgi:hypothetical protein
MVLVGLLAFRRGNLVVTGPARRERARTSAERLKQPRRQLQMPTQMKHGYFYWCNDCPFTDIDSQAATPVFLRL